MPLGNREPSRVLEQGSAHRCPFSHRSCPISLLGPRGMVVVADKTSELYQKTYWASYNIPYVPTPCFTPIQFSVLVRGPSLHDLFNPQSKETTLAFLWPGKPCQFEGIVVGLRSAPTAG